MCGMEQTAEQWGVVSGVAGSTGQGEDSRAVPSAWMGRTRTQESISILVEKSVYICAQS